MKKLILTSLFFLLLTPAFAQKFNVGAQIGTNISSLAVPNSNARVGYQYGGFVRYGGRGFIQVEANFSRLSTQLEAQINNLATERDVVNMNSIQFPILGGLKLITSEDESSSLRIMAGLGVAQIFDVRPNTIDVDIDDINRTQADLQAGVGLDLWFLTLDLRYQYGLRSVLEQQDGSPYRILSLSIGAKL
ncbi:porin family protein [Catalinimonas alkaloidigena]|nr:porin family protein [Catalinimonas alkaloidigena]